MSHMENSEADARFIANPLLRQEPLTAEDETVAVTRAFAWLDLHGRTENACLVLVPLLGLKAATTAEQTIARAMDWLEHHGRVDNAQFVLRALLDRKDEEAER